ncbi:hypothetical protein KQX54_021047 [Cotesia glomerata]|uniref:Uncharacterized protein n=1 Tax=Cotesia glomerata TaxID=32391 RepID=A0AAV7J974_COTGL|nr:hypothetical protein KQX54_021047 [Cotesia glomerata]
MRIRRRSKVGCGGACGGDESAAMWARGVSNTYARIHSNRQPIGPSSTLEYLVPFSLPKTTLDRGKSLVCTRLFGLPHPNAVQVCRRCLTCYLTSQDGKQNIVARRNGTRSDVSAGRNRRKQWRRVGQWVVGSATSPGPGKLNHAVEQTMTVKRYCSPSN